MSLAVLEEHVEGLEKVLCDLSPDLLSASDAEALVGAFSRGEKLCASGRTLLARLIADAKALARSAGITEGEAAQSVAASRTAAEQPELEAALRTGELSGDQANAVAKGAKADPAALDALLESARTKSVTQLRDEARRTELRSKDADDLFKRQRAARSLRTWVDEMGMVCGSFKLTPETGAGFRALIEAEGKRLHRIARRSGITDPYEAHLADALAGFVAGTGTGTGPRAEVVVDVSLEALWRGAASSERGGDEVCEVRGVGPIPVWRAREILENAFLKALLTDGTDVILSKHFGTRPSAEIKTALDWRDRVCVDCGSSFHLEDDHVDPRANRGETSYRNLARRCWPCHVRKTDEDRRKGLLGKEPPRRRK